MVTLEQPLRTPSLIASVFGDAIAPRGGSVWLGTLSEILGVFGIAPGSVRTALSRLAADGWVERMRDGRESHYSLTAGAEQEFGQASEAIYRLGARAWDGEWRIAVLTEADESARRSLRSGLARSGYGQLSPNVLITPNHGEPDGGEAEGVLLLTGARTIGGAGARPLVREAWPLDDIAAAYRRLMAAFEPIEARADRPNQVSDLEALALRIFVIHQLRRVVLKDPDLPEALLPDDWPAAEARQRAAAIWLAFLKPSERWLDSRGRCATGRLPPPTKGFSLRFARPEGERG